MKKLICLFVVLIPVFGQAQPVVYKSMSEALKNPTAVTHLDLSGQGLKKVPKGVNELVNLVSLNLSNNNISYLSLPKNDKLEYLNISNNSLYTLPSFIELKTGDRSIIMENNPDFLLKKASGNRQKIDIAGYEGSIVALPTSHILKASDNNGEVVKIMPEGTESKYWLELRKRNMASDKILFNAIENSSIFEFGYYVNRHLSFNDSDTLPDYLFYSGINREGGVGVTSCAAIVFFGKYYITVGSVNRSLNGSKTWDLLMNALSYQPDDDGVTVRLDHAKYEVVSPADLAARAEKPVVRPINKNLPDLPVTKDVIHTLQPGETVVFTNEYQLGIDLKNDQYYIYLKKGGKYYLKTANTTLGPYDNLFSASPEERRGLDFVHEFRAIKGGKDYFISAGKEYGPFPLQTTAIYYREQNQLVFSYERDGAGFFRINGVEYGPFPSYHYPKYYKGKLYFPEYDYQNDLLSITVDGEKIADKLPSQSRDILYNGLLMYNYVQAGEDYVRVDDKIFGPLGVLYADGIDNGVYWFYYKKDDSLSVNIDGTTYGPYNELEDFNKTIRNRYFIARKGVERFVYINGKEYGPFPFIGGGPTTVAVNDPGDAFMISYGHYEDQFLIHNGKQFGPFLEVIFPDQDAVDEMRATDATPTAIVKMHNLDYYVYVNDALFGPFKKQPLVVWSNEENVSMFIVNEEGKNGVDEQYVISSTQRIGPFKGACHNCKTYRDRDTMTFCYFPILARTADDQFYVIETGKTHGPFDQVELSSVDDRRGDFRYKKAGQWYQYYYKTGETVGPFDRVSEYAFESAGNIFDFEEAGDHTISIINSHRMSKRYSWSSETNGSNYISYSNGTSFVINNKEYNDSNILASSYHEETKTFYWLTLEGKNIVRNYVKL